MWSLSLEAHDLGASLIVVDVLVQEIILAALGATFFEHR